MLFGIVIGALLDKNSKAIKRDIIKVFLVNLVLYSGNLKGGGIIKVFVRFIRIFLIIISYLLLIFSIFTLTSGLRIKGSELLPIFFSSILNLFILLIYLRLGKLYIKNSKVSKNRII